MHPIRHAVPLSHTGHVTTRMDSIEYVIYAGGHMTDVPHMDPSRNSDSWDHVTMHGSLQDERKTWLTGLLLKFSHL